MSTRAEAKESAEGYSQELLRSVGLANFRGVVCLF